MPATALDLLEELRAALDELEPRLAGHAVDIEMPRVRVLADPVVLRRDFAQLVESVVEDAEPGDAITVHITRTGKAARVDVVDESAGARSDGSTRSMTVPLAPGTSSAADA
jgi:signal transduction histidine kinase